MTHEYVNYFEDGREWDSGLKIYVAESKFIKSLFVLYASGYDPKVNDKRFITGSGGMRADEFTFGTAERAENAIRGILGNPTQFNPPLPAIAVSKEYEELDQSEECLDDA